MPYEYLLMARNCMLSCCLYGVMTSQETDRNNIISTLIYTWPTQTFPVAYSNRNTLSISYLHPLMLHLQNNYQPSWTISSKYILCFILFLSHQASRATHSNPIHCFKADTHANVHVILRVPYLPANNPQQSEEASHMGGNANCKL